MDKKHRNLASSNDHACRALVFLRHLTDWSRCSSGGSASGKELFFLAAVMWTVALRPGVWSRLIKRRYSGRWLGKALSQMMWWGEVGEGDSRRKMC